MASTTPRRHPGWAAFRLVMVLAIGVVSLMVLHRPALALVEALASPAVERAERALSRSRTARAGPPIVWLHWDDASRAALGPANSPFVSRSAIARALDVIRAAPGAGPLLVYVDVAIALPSGDPAGEAELARSLAAWARDGERVPPVAIHAGPACLSPAQDAGGGTSVIKFTEGGYAAAVDLPETMRPSRSRIVWSCPLYADMVQNEWSCVEVAPGSGKDPLAALPSPAWFARAVADSRSAVSARMMADLRYADGVCGMLDPDEGGTQRPLQSRVRFDAAWALTDGLVDGRTIQREISLVSFLDPAGDRSALNDAIVVIGGGTSLIPDMHRAGQGYVPGALLVGGAMRDAWMFGLPIGPSALIDALWTALILLLLALLTQVILPWGRGELLKRSRGWRKVLLFAVTHEQVWLGTLLGLALTSAGFFPYDLTLPTVFAVGLAELLLLMNAMEREWYEHRAAP